MSMEPSASPFRALERWIGHAHAAMVVVPALFLVWPGPKAPMQGDLMPMLTGAAIAALASVMPLVALMLRRARVQANWIWLFVAFALIGIASLWVQPPSDTLEASRAKLVLAVALVMLVAGASLERETLVTTARALVVLTFVVLLPAFTQPGRAFAGALGNTGSTSEVALAGAAAGAWLAASDRGAWRWVGLLASASYALYTGLAPVLAGALSLAAVTVLALAFDARRRVAWGLTLATCVLLFGAGRLVPHGSPAPSGTSASASSDTSGIEVRRRIWARIPGMVRDWGLWGAGPGQFRAAFPPYRDPEEIERSSHARTLAATETEVEHAHSDLLQAFVDSGPIGGALWLVFLAAVAWRALRALRADDHARAPLGWAALALLVNACFREPLLANPASSSVAFGLFGVLLVPPPAKDGSAFLGRVLPYVAMAALALQLQRAWAIAWHGRALTQYVATGDRAFVELAGELCPDSVVVRATAARAVETLEGDRPSLVTVEAWRSVLELRPHNVEALTELGLAFARQRRVDEARAAWRRALALDPASPTLRANLARLEALDGDLDEAARWIEAQGKDVPTQLRGYAVAALHELEVERGWALFEYADPELGELGAERAYATSRSDDSALSESERRALEGSAHTTWAREHGAHGDPAAALRSYRQAKRCLAREAEPGSYRWSVALHLELAGALAAGGDVDEARAELDGVRPAATDLARIPAWVGEALLRNDLLSR